MYLPLEGQIVRGLAVMALAAAVLTAGVIISNSGMFGGGSGSSTGVSDTVGAAAGTTSGAAADGTSATATTSSRSYVVKDGDSFYTISREFNTTIAAIQQLNPNLDPSNLTPGTRIAIP
ncbi:MAG: LysM peptidoglycan-binding domain-containing protein [Thermoleophilia bacterium]